MNRLCAPLGAFCLVLACSPGEEALELRNLGLAELENERPEEAEATFRRLLAIEHRDPLPAANLAVALLRQQREEEALAAIEEALGRAPGRGDLLAIKGDIHVWDGQFESALEALSAAVDASPQDPEIVYALYRHATTMPGDAGAAAAARAVRKLKNLRPDNLVVLLEVGQLAIAEADRSTATGAYLRVRELLWQADPAANQLLRQILEALEEADPAAARVPALRLGNLLKITPMFKSSMTELYNSIQGIPVERFAWEPEPTAFGEPVDVRFQVTSLSSTPGWCNALASADLDGDGLPDLVRITGGEPAELELRFAAGGLEVGARRPSPGLCALLPVDLDNDGQLDLIGYGGPEGTKAQLVFWRGGEGGSFEEATAELGLAGLAATAVAPLDFDSDGDLDLAVAADGAVELYLNSLEGALRPVGSEALPELAAVRVHELIARDLDRDGDSDLLLLGAVGPVWLDNLRQGRFADRSADSGLALVAAAVTGASADLDNDGLPDLILAGRGLQAWRSGGSSYLRWPLEIGAEDAGYTSVVVFDADNDGRLDFAAAGEGGVTILAQRGVEPRFGVVSTSEPVAGFTTLVASDLDGDGDVDLVASGPGGLVRLSNEGGNRNHWLSVRLQGLRQGNEKNNFYGRSATVEVRVGRAYQYREVSEAITHFGLGRHSRADSMRVVWANGVPQHRLHPEANQRVVEEQILKGSCPFLYAWGGEESGVVFVTDLLWGAPLGMPVAPGVWAGADPEELVRVDGVVPRDGLYDLRITEELWEAAFFDRVRLWVVDHPEETEVASTLKVIPGQTVADTVVGTRGVRAVKGAWDGEGREVTARVLARDTVYADGYPVGDYQGITPEPWSFTFDLGEAPGRSVRLLLDGWIFPADASLNLAAAQRRDLDIVQTRLEVATARGWLPLLDPMGFPAGKTKTLVIDTPPLPEGARRLRVVSSHWLSWDRVAWSVAPSDAEAEVIRRMVPTKAELQYRGFSRLERRAPNAPHVYDYAAVEASSPWLPFPGRYTRYGDVRELLLATDDRSVIMAAGDELRLEFDASDLPPVESGRRRTVFLESYGWDKDADRNTFAAKQVEPLPFGAMSGYPYGEGETFPQSASHQAYQRDWLTRVVTAPPRF